MLVGLPKDENSTKVRRFIINVLIKPITQENVFFAIYSNQRKGFCCFFGPILVAKLHTGQTESYMTLNKIRHKNSNKQSG